MNRKMIPRRYLLAMALIASAMPSSAMPSSANFLEAHHLVGVPNWYWENSEVQRLLDNDGERDLAQIIGFADPEVCYPSLQSADLDNNRLVDSEEYVTFCKQMGPDDYLEGINTFADLPLILQVNFNVLACLCQSNSQDNSCCVGPNAGISTEGAYEGETPTPEEESHLFIVCSLTTTSINRVLASSPPSQVPSGSPSSIPSIGPTIMPSALPTLAPSVTPSVIPTIAPASASPTVLGETPAPTTTPVVQEPSESPTVLPTAFTTPPTFAPTGVPQPTEESVTTVYQIGIENGATSDTYVPTLTDAMDTLAPQILLELQRRILRTGRRLQSMEIPTTVDDLQVIGTSQYIIKRISHGGAFGTHSITLLHVYLCRMSGRNPGRRCL